MIGPKLGARRQLQTVLFLMSLHSFLTGLGLLFFPVEWLQFLGLETNPQRFFISQGGVFHLLMAGAYTAGMLRPRRNVVLIRLAIIVKICAALFLFLFFILKQPVPFVLLNAALDGCFGWVLIVSFNKMQQVETDVR